MLFFEVMPIAQEMYEASPMQSLMTSVGGVEVAAQHPLEVLTQQGLDHFVPTRVMVLQI